MNTITAPNNSTDVSAMEVELNYLRQLVDDITALTKSSFDVTEDGSEINYGNGEYVRAWEINDIITSYKDEFSSQD